MPGAERADPAAGMAPFWAAYSLLLPALLFDLLSGPVREPQGVGYSPQANVIAVASAGPLSRWMAMLPRLGFR